MSDLVISFGDLAWAAKINTSKKYDNTTLLVISPVPTKDINPLFVSYHWFKCQRKQQSYFQMFSEVDMWLSRAEEENWRAVICAPERSVAYALSRLRHITDPSKKELPMHEILSKFPDLRQDLPRSFRYELVLYRGWINNDEFCKEIVDNCSDDYGKFDLNKVSTQGPAALKKLRELADFEPDILDESKAL